MGKFSFSNKESAGTTLTNPNNAGFFSPAQKIGGKDNQLSVFNVPAPEIHKTPFGISATLYFAKDSFLLDSANFEAAQQLAEELKFLSKPNVTVNGHASAEGSAEHNQSLSESRRDAVILLLKSQKTLGEPVFTGKGLGTLEPAVPENGATDTDKEAQRKLNRRVEVVILYPPSAIHTGEEKGEPGKTGLPGIDRPFGEQDIPDDVKQRWEQQQRIKEMLKPIPPGPKQRSLNDIIWGKVSEVTSKALKGLGIKGKWNERLTEKLVDAFKAGGEKALDAVLDQTNLDSQQKEMLKKSIEAASKTKFIP